MIQDIQEAFDLRQVIARLKGVSASGISGVELATGAGITLGRVKELADKHADYFVKVGNTSAYSLNRFSALKGSVPNILNDIRRQESELQRRARGISPGLWFLVGWLIWRSGA